DRGVAGPVVRPARGPGEAGQEAAGPGGAPVGGGGKADGGATAVEDPPALEGAHDRRAEGEGGGFDLGAMLAGGVGERVGAHLGERDVGEGRAGGAHTRRGE